MARLRRIVSGISIGRRSVRSDSVRAPNYTLKPSRPGFGPAAEPPWPNSTCTASRRLQIGASSAAAAVPLFAQPRGPRPRSLA